MSASPPEASPSTTSEITPSPPRWAWGLAGALLAMALAVLVWGRGGTLVLAGATLAFLALAVLLLSVPDGDPGVH